MDCQVIRDLIPLCKEDLASLASKKIVEEHLLTCKECKAYYDSLEENKIESTEPLDFLDKAVNKNKKYYGLMIGSLVLSIFLIIFSFLTSPRPIDYDKDLIKSSTNDDEIIYEFRDDVTRVYTVVSDEGDFTNKSRPGKSLYIDASYTYLDRILGGKKQTLKVNKKDYDLIFYNKNGDGSAKVLYDPYSLTINSGSLLLPRLIFAIYIKIAFVITLILLALNFTVFSKSTKYKKIRIVTLPLAYILSTFLIKGLNFASMHPVRDFVFIVLTTFSIYLLIVTISLYLENKDKYKLTNWFRYIYKRWNKERKYYDWSHHNASFRFKKS